MHKHFRQFTCLTVLAALAFTGCGQKKSDKPSVAFVTNGIANFWTYAKAGATAGANEFNVDVDIRMPADGIVDQKQIIEDLLVRGVDGIAISPIDADNQNRQINEACEATHLITHDSDAPDTDRLCYVGMDNYEAGRMVGELVKEALPDGGEVMLFIGRLGQENAKRRRQGVIDELLDRPYNPENYDAPGKELAGDRYTIVDTRTDGFDLTKARANAEDTITSYPNLRAMVGLFAYNPPACLKALEEAGKTDEIKLIAFDEDEATLAAIREGSCHGTVVQNPYRYGYESVRILAGLARGDKSVLPENGFLNIPARTIRKDNVDEFEAQLNEYMKSAK